MLNGACELEVQMMLTHSLELRQSPSISRRELILSFVGVVGSVFTRKLFAVERGLHMSPSALIVLKSIHHKNTARIAQEIAGVLGAEVKEPHQITFQDFQKYKLIGFGSGIYDQRHHRSILELVDTLPNNFFFFFFIFSTSGVSRKTCLRHSIEDPHQAIRSRLLIKGCKIVDEFNCTGWNTNSFLKVFGGINRDKPNADDLDGAKRFAEKLRVGVR